MSIQSRISAIHDLGQFISFATENEADNYLNKSKYEYLKDEFDAKLKLAEIHNPWFTIDNLNYCIKYWGQILTEENLFNWVNNYTPAKTPKNVGIIMAGN